MRIITDFDGPIMDLSDRYYHVYQLCLARVRLPEQLLQPLSQAEFWQRKRACVTEIQIGIDSGLTPAQAVEFKQLRDRHAHQLQYLDLDRIVLGAIDALEQIHSAGIELIVMTLRRNSQLNAALTCHNLARFFPPDCRYCHTDDHHKQGDIDDKTQLMAAALADLGAKPETWMIGDTEADIIAAHTYNIPAIGVLSGIRDRDRLLQYQPDRIFPDLAAAVQWLITS